MIRKFVALGAILFVLAACGGGGGGGGGSSVATSGGGASSSGSGGSSGGGTSTAPALTNFTTLTVDSGPAALGSGPNGYISDNIAFVSVTLCAPGSTANCQTIDHVQVDTGSVGLRILSSAISPALLAALPNQADTSANPVGACYGFVDGYAFGSVRQADFKIGGEAVANMPLQLIGDTGAFATVPSSCSSGGGTNLNTVQNLGANGIIGLGVTTTDCGTICAAAGGNAAAIYYDCPSAGCGAIIARAAATTAPFQQLPNPVAAMSVDNNGTVISLPAVPAAGEASLTGTLYFGIGTQTNNGLGSASVVATSASTDSNGAGLITAIYKGQSLPDSFLDSGSTQYVFVDSAIPLCTDKNYAGYYCPGSPLTLSPTLQGAGGAMVSATFPLYNAQTLLSTSFSVLPGVGGSPTGLNLANAYPTSFDFGLPFFYGRNVYTAIEGRTAGSATGPYFAY